MEENIFRVITLGSYGTGKTSLLLKATNPNTKITDNYICTLGVDFKTKEHLYQGIKYKLRIWDTAGQEKYFQINRLYYKDVDAVLLVYDIGNLESFNQLKILHDDFFSSSGNKGSVILVGTKSDVVLREVSQDMAKQQAELWQIPRIECSAIKGENIEGLFDLLLQQLMQAGTVYTRRESIVLKPNHKVIKKSCAC